MRRAHVLRRNHKTTLPNRVIFVDTETNSVRVDRDTERAELWFGVGCYQRRTRGDQWTREVWCNFTTQREFWEWATAKAKDKCKLYIIAHNQTFDFNVLQGFKHLPAMGWKMVKAIIEGPPTYITFTRGKQTIVILCSLNFYRMPLADIGENLGIPKLTMPAKTAPMQEWYDYCTRDVVVLQRAMHEWWNFIRSEDLGGFQLTIASQAFAAFRHRFMDHEIVIDDHEEALQLARNAFMGGRTETHYIGRLEGKYWLVDVNSMYPFVMRDNDYPTSLVSVYKNVTMNELGKWLKQYCVIAECVIETSEPVYPVRHENKLIFPTGLFESTLSTPELIYALENGHIRKVKRASVYEKANIFTDFIDWMYTTRRRYKDMGNTVWSWLVKILGNSLYGKWGQNGFVFKEVYTVDNLDIKVWTEYDAETGEKYRMRQFCGVVQEKKRNGESSNSHPAIAAHVTAYARIYLYKLMKQAELVNVFYNDTDSLLLNEVGFNNLHEYINEKELGALSIDGVYDYVSLYGAKDYVMGHKWKTKGVRKNALQTSPNTFEQDKFVSFKGMLQRGDLNTVYIHRVTKNLSRKYDKGVTQPDGRVTPHVFAANVLATWA